MRSRLTRRRFAILALPVIFSGCGIGLGTGEGRVAVDTLTTDILFGAHVQASPTPQPTAPPVEPPLQPLQPPPLTFGNFDFGSFFPAPAPVAACPRASDLSFPAQIAGPNVTAPPATGGYRWVQSGGLVISTGTSTVTIPLAGFHQEYIRNVGTGTPNAVVPTTPGEAGPDYTFESIVPSALGGNTAYLKIQWQVKANGTTTTQGAQGVFVTAQDPEAGLALKQIERLDAAGATLGPYFKPTSGLLFLPLPVAPGAQWTSTGIDPQGQTMTLAGQVLKRDKVDACGDLVQGWAVHATLTSGASTSTLDYMVATQMGGILVSNNIDGQYFNGTFAKALMRIGQLKANPLPAMFK